jgi:hypothetical protein
MHGVNVLFHMAGMHTKLCLFLMISLKTSYDIEKYFLTTKVDMCNCMSMMLINRLIEKHLVGR